MAGRLWLAPWCALAALLVAAAPGPGAAQDAGKSAAAAQRAQQERIRALEERAETAERRMRNAEAEAADERRRADAVVQHANHRIADSIADAERRARQAGVDLEQVRRDYDLEVGGLQRLLVETAARVRAVEIERWVWSALALALGVVGGILVRGFAQRSAPVAATSTPAAAASVEFVATEPLIRQTELFGPTSPAALDTSTAS
jgi:hypothetical protein